MDTPLDLSLVIPVLNEAVHLPGCLEAIGQGFAQEVVVIDSGSSDGSRAIAGAWGARVIPFQWNGQYPKKRNWYLLNHAPKTRWVLFLDADEYLTPAFKQALQKELPLSKKAGYWLSYCIYFQNRALKGGYPLKKLALFRVGAGLYERIEEQHWSKLDMEIHEHPQLNGPVGEIKSRIDHRDNGDLAKYEAKHWEYARWEAARYLQAKNDRSLHRQWTWKQRIKYALMPTPFLAPLYFMGSYFLLGGFRDGVRGLAFARLKMNYFKEVYTRIRQLKKAHQAAF